MIRFACRAARTAAAALALAAASYGLAAGAECSAVPGGRVLLASDAVDPDVFLWDSRTRLADYAAGSWGNTRAIFAHTMLAEPGTLALVVSCVPAAAHPKFSPGDEDAIGVRIVSGPYRGRYGWVLSSDIHVPHASGDGAILGRSKN